MKPTHKLVILGEDSEFYRLAYSDLINNSIKYLDGFYPKNNLIRILFKLHCSSQSNTIIRLPFKPLWNKLLFKKINCKTPSLFIAFRSWLSIDKDLKWIQFLKSQNKDNKIVIFLHDILSSYRDYSNHQPIDINKYKEVTDLILSYDKQDVQKYGLTYHPTVLSNIHINNSNKPKSDIFFIGKDKGRIDILRKIHLHLSTKGINCLFMVSDVPSDKRNFNDGIIYINNHLSYSEILEYVKNSKCLLEIIQPNAVGITYRTLESIVFNKKLITNNLSTIDEEIYDDRYISLLTQIEDINIDFIDNNEIAFPEGNPYLQKINPKALIKDIENILGISVDLTY